MPIGTVGRVLNGIYERIGDRHRLGAMKIRLILAAVVTAVGIATPAHADIPEPPPRPTTSGAWITGIGQFVYHEVNVEGHRITFGLAAGVTRNGTAYGVLTYRHALPDGQLLASGWADVTCVNVRGDTALVTAVVPNDRSTLVNHGFYLKIVGGDRIELAQTGGDPAEPARRHCIDTADVPGINRYPVEPGRYLFGS